MDKQQFIDHMLETENLTDNLEDDAADLILNWGISQLDRLLVEVADEEAAAYKVDDLMTFMRSLNRLLDQPTPAPEKVAELAAHYARVFGAERATTVTDHAAAAAEVAGLSGVDAVKYLLAWVEKK